MIIKSFFRNISYCKYGIIIEGSYNILKKEYLENF